MGDITSEKDSELLELNTENGEESVFEEQTGFSDEPSDTEEQPKEKKKFISYDKKNKKFSVGKLKISRKVAIILLIILIIIGLFSACSAAVKKKNSAKVMYTDAAVERRTIKNTITGSSSVLPNDSFNVTTIKSGDIKGDYFKEGDIVKKGDKLYQFDDKDARNSLSSAQNALTKAQQAYVDAVKQKAQTVSSNNIGTKSAQNSVTKALNSLGDAQSTYNYQYPSSDISGKVKEVYVKQGDNVNAGSNIALVYDDTAMKIRLPFNDYDAESVYAGETAEVSVVGTGDKIYGTVTEKSSGASATDAHGMIVYVTIEVANPGALTESDSGSAVVGGAACSSTAKFEYIKSQTVAAKTSGKIEQLNVSAGDGVYSGQQIAYIKSDNANTTLSNAQLSYNDAVLALEKQVLQNDTFSQDSSIKNAQLALDDAKLSLQKAQDAVEDYIVEAPIEGTVVTKNSKAGDTIDSSKTSSEALCVIYDLSSVKFTIDVDETEVALVKTGQKAKVTADAVDGEFEGIVTKVPVDGVNQNGVTTYTIEIQIKDYGDLLPGMNIDAEIVVEEADNVISVPLNSVNRGNIVFVKDDGEKRENDVTDIIKNGRENGEDKKDNKDGKKSDDKKQPEQTMPVVSSVDDKESDTDKKDGIDKSSVPMNIEVPDGYRAILVETGINDTEYIEVKSGIKESDMVRTLDANSSSEGASFGEEGMMPPGGMQGMQQGMGHSGMQGGMSGGSMQGGGMSSGGMSGGGASGGR